MKQVLVVFTLWTWFFLTIFLALGWQYERFQNDGLRENIRLWKKVRAAEVNACKGVMRVNQACADVATTLVERLGLDPELESVMTNAILSREEAGGMGGE